MTIYFLFIAELTTACDCDSQKQFLTVSANTKLVALVRVSNYLLLDFIGDVRTQISMQVEIINIFKGNESRSTITVWGNNGNLCRAKISSFDIGKYYVIAFDKGSDGLAHKDEKNTDYTISNCQYYWLNADNETKNAYGSLSSTMKSISFNDLIDYFNYEGKTNLTREDYNEIFQNTLNLPELQKYYQIETDSSSKLIYIQNSSQLDKLNLNGVIIFGKEVIIFTSDEIKHKALQKYFVLGEWNYEPNKVRLKLSYAREGLVLFCTLQKTINTWTIISKELIEE